MKLLTFFFLICSFGACAQSRIVVKGAAATTSKGIEVFNVEDYGAVRIDPANPSAATDATAAIQACINDAYSKSNNPVIYVPYMYRLNADPSKVVNGNQIYYMLYIPLTAYNGTSMNHHSITFKFGGGGNQEHLMPMNSINGAGFYCTRVETTDRGAAVLGSEKPTGTFVPWGPWNYTNVYIEGLMKVIVETKSGSTNITNYMSGVDLNNFTQISFDRIFARTTTTYSDAGVNPPSTTFGLKMPQMNNHAVLHGNAFYGVGWGTALYTGEHAQIGDVLAVGNKVGVNVGTFYPAVIGNLCTEDNAVNIQTTDNTFLNIGSWNGEDYTFNSPYYLRAYDVKFVGTNPAKSHISVGQFVVHDSGGNPLIPLISSTAIDLKITSDEGGVNRIPLNSWNTAGRPTTIRPYEWGLNTDLSKLEYYNGTWNSIGGTTGLTVSTGKPSGQNIWIETADNSIHYVIGTKNYRVATADSSALTYSFANTEASDYYTRVTAAGGTMSYNEQQAYDNLVTSAKAHGYYTTLLTFYPYQGGVAAAQKLNAISSSYTQTWNTVTFVSGANGGVKGNGTSSYIQTGLTPSTALTMNNTLFGSWIVENVAASSFDGGANNGSGIAMVWNPKNGQNAAAAYSYSTGAGDFATASTADATGSSGIWGVNKSSSTSLTLYRNSTALATASPTATASLPALEFYFLAENLSGTASVFSARTHKCDYIGASMTSTQWGNFVNDLTNYMNAIGR